VNINQFEWLQSIAKAAADAEHVWPEMAGCEAALESGWGSSALAREGNNLFGMKQHQHPIYGTLMLPTHEVIDGAVVQVNANWVKYESIEECFADRMETLLRLRDTIPHYARALAAPDAVTYVNEVSQSWSTDPERAHKVVAIWSDFKAIQAEYLPITGPRTD